MPCLALPCLAEVLYIPNKWYHLTLNLDECVFVTIFV